MKCDARSREAVTGQSLPVDPLPKLAWWITPRTTPLCCSDAARGTIGGRRDPVTTASEDWKREEGYDTELSNPEVAAAVQWAERIMRRIDGAFPK